MAKPIVFETEPDDIRDEYEIWVAGTVEKEIPVNMLYEHPQNYDLVGHIDKNTRAELLEDIKQNGIREPLQVWYNAGKLFVVSGNERLSIAKELKYKTVKCVKVDFKDNDEVLRFIYAVNKHRKQVKTGAADLLLKLFPPDKYPLLYKDLRANYDYDKSENTAGIITPDEAWEKREKERKQQQELKQQVSETLGITEKTTDKIRRQASQKAALNKTKSKQQEKPGKRPPEVNKALRAYLDHYVKEWKGADREAVKALLIKYIKNI